MAQHVRRRFPDLSFGELVELAKVDVLKWIVFILSELLEKGRSEWSLVRHTQIAALDEIDHLVEILRHIEEQDGAAP